MIRDGQLEFCSGCRAAPNFESGANSFRPFPHTRESPMSVASRMQHLRIDPAAVVADDYPKALGRIFKFDFDAAIVSRREGIQCYELICLASSRATGWR